MCAGIGCFVGCIRLMLSKRVCELLGGEQGVVYGQEQFAGWVLLSFTHGQEAIIANDKSC